MADEASGEKPAKASDGVFGNLPATRPGTRSPRRRNDEAPPERPATAEPRTAKPAPPPPPPKPAPPPAPAAKAAPPAEEPSAQRIGSIEDLAWAGVAVAAQAATVGVKFASRAIEAARRSADSRDEH